MSTISEWSSRACFAWAVERPLEGRPRYSQKFSISNAKTIYLQISLMNKTYAVAVRPQSAGYFHAGCITVHVEDRKGNALPSLSRRTYVPDNLSIWFCPESDLLKAVPDLFEDGLLIFLVTIDARETKYDFVLEPPTTAAAVKPVVESRSVQTEEISIQTEEISVQTSQYMNDISSLENLSSDLSGLLQDQDSRPDVVLVCRDRTVRAHSQVLCARSRVFAATLRGDLTEAQTGQIEVQEMDEANFDPFVRYLYTGKLSKLTAETATGLYEAADRYHVPSLMRRCASFLEESLAPDNACDMLVVADAHSDQGFKEIAIDYILKDKIPLQDDHWLPFSEGHPKLANQVLLRFFKSQTK